MILNLKLDKIVIKSLTWYFLVFALYASIFACMIVYNISPKVLIGLPMVGMAYSLRRVYKSVRVVAAFVRYKLYVKRRFIECFGKKMWRLQKLAEKQISRFVKEFYKKALIK